MNLRSAKEIVQELASLGNVARQNEKDVPLDVTLGGRQFDRNGFNGMVLWNRKKEVVFGACPTVALKLREQTMVKRQDKWVRRKEAIGPETDLSSCAQNQPPSSLTWL